MLAKAVPIARIRLLLKSLFSLKAYNNDCILFAIVANEVRICGWLLPCESFPRNKIIALEYIHHMKFEDLVALQSCGATTLIVASHDRTGKNSRSILLSQ
jgi:hypothetical protein